MTWLSASDEGAILTVRVIPRAAKDQIVGVFGSALKIKVRAPALDGKANKSLLALLANAIGVSVRRIEVLSGEKSRNKRILAVGATVADVRRRLCALVDG